MSPIGNTVFGILFIFACTTFGSALVFFLGKKRPSKALNQLCLGFAAGIMLSASFFSLIKPAIETDISYMPSYAVVAISIFLGALFMYGIDKLVPHIHPIQNTEEGPESKMQRVTKMFLAVTIHNVPEGLSVGIAYGVGWALLNSGDTTAAATALTGAMMLAIGIGIQNVPEGTSVALPFQAETGKTGKAFLFGTLSGAVEPVAAVIGLFLAYSMEVIMPWALSFAAGCMIYVIVEEVVPECQEDSTHHYGVWAFIIGFLVMMVLDVALS
ncbi:MAG: ZIP family metal transporter [Bacilli bacterium]|jgi:ZIP family zinc transporter|nr:ZIP family metal transporter [Bacilli bacterium]